jgi:hypothetical protein
MTNSTKTTLKQLMTRLHEQGLEMATLRAALDVQFTRIAQMQAELDLLPQARRRRQTLRVLLAAPPPHKCWDGPERRHGQSTEELRAYLRALRVAWETRPEQVHRDYDEEQRARVGQAEGHAVADGDVIKRAAGYGGPMIEHLTIMGRPDEPVRLPTKHPSVTDTAKNSTRINDRAPARTSPDAGALSRARVAGNA